MLTDEAPGTAVTGPPTQLVVVAGAEATTTFAGKLSVSAALVNELVRALVIVTVSIEVEPAGIELGEKLLESVAPDVTARLREAAAALVIDWVSPSAPIGIV